MHVELVTLRFYIHKDDGDQLHRAAHWLNTTRRAIRLRRSHPDNKIKAETFDALRKHIRSKNQSAQSGRSRPGLMPFKIRVCIEDAEEIYKIATILQKQRKQNESLENCRGR